MEDTHGNFTSVVFHALTQLSIEKEAISGDLMSSQSMHLPPTICTDTILAL